MTPFGEKVRTLRESRGITLTTMANDIGVSPAYLSALEHGKRGRPSWKLVQHIISYFNIIWDDAEQLAELARLSHPKITIDTSGLDPIKTEVANRLSRQIKKLDEASMQELLKVLSKAKPLNLARTLKNQKRD